MNKHMGFVFMPMSKILVILLATVFTCITSCADGTIKDSHFCCIQLCKIYKIPIFVSTGEITTRLRSCGSRTDNERDQFDSDVAMDENNQINAATHNTEGVLLI